MLKRNKSNIFSQHHDEEFHTLDNYLKIATSFCLAFPAYNGLVVPASHAFVDETANSSSGSVILFARLLNPISWGILTTGCLLHHCNPSSKFFHDVDHWAAQIAANLVLLYLEGLHPVVLFFFFINLRAFRNFYYRQITILLQVGWMLFRFPSPEGYISGATTICLFVAQRARVLYAHSLWHLSMGLLGYYTTRACTI